MRKNYCKQFAFILSTNSKRAKVQHLHVQIACVSYYSAAPPPSPPPPWGTPSYKFDFRSSMQKNVLRGKGRHKVWYRGTMFSQVVSYDSSFNCTDSYARIYFVPRPCSPRKSRRRCETRRLFALFEAI